MDDVAGGARQAFPEHADIEVARGEAPAGLQLLAGLPVVAVDDRKRGAVAILPAPKPRDRQAI